MHKTMSGWQRNKQKFFKMEEPQKDAVTGKTEVVQAQVDEVKEVMDKNIQDMIERGEKLDDLEKRTAAITEGAQAFNKNTEIVKKKLWWKNIKAAITFALVVLLIITGLVIYYVISNRSTSK